jgi:predicted glycogen debranching enzyme
MPMLQKTDDTAIASVAIRNKPVKNLLNKEWLLTNSRGGYSSSTIICCNTSRYHGLLIGSLNPPVNRIMGLSNCLETIVSQGRAFHLSTFEFDGKFSPEGFGGISQFRRDIGGVHFDYRVSGVELTKSVYLLRDSDTVAVEYNFVKVGKPVEFVLRPFVGLRNFHTLQKSHAPLCARWLKGGLLVRHNVPGSCELFMRCPAMNFEKDEKWWFNFLYRGDGQRGYDFMEDLWTPGFFKCRIDLPVKIVFWGHLGSYCEQELADIKFDIDAAKEDLHRHYSVIIAAAKTRDERLRTLCLAAEQFIAKRRVNSGSATTILAGFPWFGDWGRDTFISLPGLLLSTGRFDEAKSILTYFAGTAENGMIPNCFDDTSHTAYFNSVDASLWFVNAAFQYLQSSGDSKGFADELLPVIRRIMDSYQKGTRFGIRADDDGLITAGNEQTQLTWMDAKYGDTAFTPRYGKTVEVNSLWYSNLCRLTQFYDNKDADAAKYYRGLAEKVEGSFRKLFWNESAGYLNDCILPGGAVDASLRPNQIFAVSLPFSALLPQQQKAVVNVVRKELLTPYGLRTLNVQDSRYKGHYVGTPQQRDAAYHQGTVWAYLIGPFVEAYLKVNGFSRKSKDNAAEFIEPLMKHLTEDGCLGQVSEIFDGDPPHTPRGCIAQAWSVAELIRAYQLING